MDKKSIKIVIFLLIPIFYLGMFQTQGITETVQPDNSIKIVLRAPTSEQPQLLKTTTPKKPKIVHRRYRGPRHKREVKTADVKGATVAIKGFMLSLPKNTPVFFGVEQVNTLLYSVEITAAQETSETAETRESFDWSKVYDLFKTFASSQANITGDAKPSAVETAKTELENLVKAIEVLNKEWDALLYQTEKASFYAGSTAQINASFAKIRDDAEESTKKLLEALIRDNRLVDGKDFPDPPRGTSEEISDLAAAALQRVNEIHKTNNVEPPRDLPKDLSSDISNDIAKSFRNTVKRLREIESATWTRDDTETRILKDQLKYICVFKPRKEDSPLKTIKHEVIVKGIAEGWVIKFAASPLTVLSGLRDESYVIRPPEMENVSPDNETPMETPTATNNPAVGNVNTDDENPAKAPAAPNNSITDNETENEVPPEMEMNQNEIQRVGKEDFANLSPAGALVHVYHTKCPNLGLSGLLGVDGNKNPQLGIGGSLLFHTAEEHTVAFTGGAIVGKVKSLDGYEVGDQVGVNEFPGGIPPTKLVHRPSWFVAITFSFKLDLFGSKVN